ncbi:MAG: hypothetical protein Q9200_006748, partial [Gallowayella weberi]
MLLASSDAFNDPVEHGDEPPSVGTLQPRAFQYEMLEESLQRNIIVALVWFLAPNVALADQQAKVIATQIPSVQSRLLIGADGVDHWSEQWIWDGVLKGISIVISTHQVGLGLNSKKILLDALTHGFVQMSRLSLLVFDEAHHCMSNHPASRILRDFYHPHRATDQEQTPAILGLTASPVVNSKVGQLEQLETNLHAISRTPKVHREELLRHVHRPALVTLAYAAVPMGDGQSPLLSELRRLTRELDIEQDPYVRALKSDPASCDSAGLQRVMLSRKTYCQEQLKNLATRADIVEKELGPWGSYWFIIACIQKLQLGIKDRSNTLEQLDDNEKTYLERCLSSLLSCVSEETLPVADGACLSNKVLRLLDFLAWEQLPGFTGLVFVKTRAEVAVLAELLSIHPQTKSFYTVSTFVGQSNSSKRKLNIAELVDVRSQVDTLDDLRLGRKNLVVTTSALEEGIDVSACNVVICFDKPANLKSLIQRRGRARKVESKLTLMLADDENPSTVTTWQELEEAMRRQYEDDMRQLQVLEELEAIDEGEREFVVETTGAKLLLADAVRHLYHFCATLPSRQLSQPAPIFTYSNGTIGKGPLTITAKVVLPISVDISVREACGRSVWRTERNAKRDAAFEAYIQLYNAGLISDNLLPIRGYDQAIAEVKTEVGKIPSLVQVAGQINPWHLLALQWQSIEDVSDLSRYDLLLNCNHETVLTIQVIVPCSLPTIPAITLFWDASMTLTACVQPSSPVVLTSVDIDSAAQSTQLLLSSVFRSKMDLERFDFIALFTPTEHENEKYWAEQFDGTIKGGKLKQIDVSLLSISKLGLIRDMTRDGLPHILRGFETGSSEPAIMTSIPQDSGDGGDELLLHVSRFPKRTDFLHPVSSNNQKASGVPNKILLKPEDCEIDKLPLPYAYLAATIPSILHRIGVRLTAANLCNTLLSTVGFEQLDLVVTSITATSAQEPTNYQRQEYLGDSVLKFLTSLTLMSEQIYWHEGILSSAKDHIVSNASLAKAALAAELDTFIQTKPFTGAKWRPLYVSDCLKSAAGEPREMSTKTLADIVEALIGAAFLDGGFDKAIATLRIFLPRISWSEVVKRNEILFSAYQIPICYPPPFTQLEQIVDYNFGCKTLPIEALTHPSFMGTNVTASYDRLEFLGDVCLDIIVSTTSFTHQPPIPTHGLHLIRTAVVNANFLAFLCLTLAISVPRTNIVTETEGKDHPISSYETTVPMHIWHFMRHTPNPGIRAAKQECLKRYREVKTAILEALRSGSHIPWSLLARLDAPKFFSDIIESLLGAIYIDSHGSLAACEGFLDRLGVMG